MLEVMFARSSLFKRIIESTKELVNDVNFRFTESGIEFSAMDGSHISFISVHLDYDDFQDYTCEREITIGISLVTLGKVLNRASDNDTLTLKLKKNTSDRLYVIFINPDNGKETKYEIRLLDIDQEQIDIPAVVYNIFIEMASSEFKRICQDQTIAEDHLTITTNQETGVVNLNTKDDINIRYTTKLEKNNSITNDKITITIGENINMSFSLKYLISFTKASILSQW
ncbi:17776_t:CDS:1 [Racocetra persica]|uniref:17776_t:CDS:1 n=1 Tax=Racocetra persica TaxID=160502 RepID=A0ACA9R346_9GLOM|nr:17776_t:CDS:1 [Racocetra persica]